MMLQKPGVSRTEHLRLRALGWFVFSARPSLTDFVLSTCFKQMTLTTNLILSIVFAQLHRFLLKVTFWRQKKSKSHHWKFGSMQ